MMKTNTLEYAVAQKIKSHVSRVKWMMKEDGFTLDQAIEEAKKSSSFSSIVWDEIKQRVLQN